MNDFKVISAQALLKVDAVAPVRGFQPLSIVMRGTNLGLATQVYFNGVLAPEFAVLSSNRLIVKIPLSQVGQQLSSIRVLTDAVLVRADAIISMSIPNPLSTISGLERLVQTFILIFLSTPGSDIFEPDSGGGAQTIIGKNTTQQGKSSSADLVLAIEKTRDEILQIQSSSPNLSLSEKLLSADVQSIKFNPDEGALTARVALTNMLGDLAAVSLG